MAKVLNLFDNKQYADILVHIVSKDTLGIQCLYVLNICKALRAAANKIPRKELEYINYSIREAGNIMINTTGDGNIRINGNRKIMYDAVMSLDEDTSLKLLLDTCKKQGLETEEQK